MRCRPLMLMLPLLALSPSSCTPEQIDSFCQIYNKVIVEKGDGKIVASEGVKKRLLANELTYRSLCPQGT
jgi:NAD(P)H-hydrate repair Nnr-like enzyme with NAD(P)H-hydrate dehydratase domain